MNKVHLLLVGLVIASAAFVSTSMIEANEGAHYYKFADLQELTHPDIFKWRFSTRAPEIEPAPTPTPKVEEELPPRETPPAVWKPLPQKMVYFDYDKSFLKPEAKAAIQKNVEYLESIGDSRVLIEGHCDERGTNEYNLALGERRAESIKTYMVSLGVSASDITTKSWGEERPAKLGHDETAWSKNRRGEMFFSEK